MNAGTIDRLPPQSLEAEMAAIGSILVDRDMLDIVAGIVRPDDFYAHVHATLFRTIVELDELREPIDKITLAQRLRATGHLENVGGLPYLTSLMESVPTAASAEYYATIVREKAILRGLIGAGGELARIGFDGEVDVDAAIAEAETTFSRAVDRGTRHRGGVSIRTAVTANYERLLRIAHGELPSNAQRLPWPKLSGLVGPTVPGELVGWVAGPKIGKSGALAMLADYIAAHYGTVAYFALEMGIDPMAMRYGALYGRVSARKQRSGQLTEAEFDALSSAYSTLMHRPIRMYDLEDVSRLADIRRELRVLARSGPIAAGIVDPINFLADVDGVKGDRSNRNERLDVVYRTLRRFAKEFDCVMHVVQHVNREGQKGRPLLSQIRDGGNLEGTAHAIIAPFRDKPDGTPNEARVAEMIVLAAREGNTGVARMEFIGARGLWLEEGTGRAWWEPELPQEADLFAGAI